MTDLVKTILAVAVAAGLVWAAYTTRPAAITDESFSDQGELFFPSFTDPTAARSLQVLTYDDQAATIRPFKVEFDGTRWVIPSHHGYPADAESNMAQASSVFIGLRKEQVVSDRAADHEQLGVLAPDEPAAPLKGRGTRVTIAGEGGAPLADLIIGKEAASRSPDASGGIGARRYVRVPGRNRVYAVEFTRTFSSAFSDWVETDLLKLGAERVDRIIVDRYEVDEAQGIKRSIEKLTILRDPDTLAAANDPLNPSPGRPWRVEAEPGGPPAEGETVNTSRVEELVGALRGLRIAGVRPKPPKLADWFAGRTDKVTQFDVLDLHSRGFFVTPQGQFVGNDGELTIGCSDGVVYTMYFGEVLFGQGEALTAGADVTGAAAKEDADKGESKGREMRYVFVHARFDESLIPAPRPPPPATGPDSPSSEEPSPSPQDEEPSLPAPGGAEQDEPPVSDQPTESESAKTPEQVEYERRLEERKAKMEAGRKRAESLARRFAEWYYVIDGEAFAKLRPGRADVVSAPASTENN